MEYKINSKFVIDILFILNCIILSGKNTICLEILNQIYSLYEQFDLGMIIYFRYLLYNYIKKHESSLYSHDIPIYIKDLLPKNTDFKTFNEISCKIYNSCY